MVNCSVCDVSVSVWLASSWRSFCFSLFSQVLSDLYWLCIITDLFQIVSSFRSDKNRKILLLVNFLCLLFLLKPLVVFLWPCMLDIITIIIIILSSHYLMSLFCLCVCLMSLFCFACWIDFKTNSYYLAVTDNNIFLVLVNKYPPPPPSLFFFFFFFFSLFIFFFFFISLLLSFS